MISVLCPSRGRPSRLRDSLFGLLDSAADRDAVEILAAMDPDDPDRAVAMWLTEPVPQIRFWTAPERWGYARLHWYINMLATLARGEWLFMWNDDCEMLTPGWDQIIHSEPPGILWPQADYAVGINTFPVLPKAWVDHVGHVSLDQSADMWWHDIGEMTGTMRKIPVSIHHEHIRGDVTANERDAVANVATFHAPDMDAARETDADRIRELLVGTDVA